MNELFDMVLDYLRGIWRNRWYALACAWLVCLVGWVMIYRLPDQYQASAQVFINTQTILRPLLQGLVVEHNIDNQILLITSTLLNRSNLEQIAEVSGLKTQGVSPKQMKRLLDRLKKNISLTGAARANLFTINFTDTDPQKVKDVLQAVVTVFERNMIGGDRTDSDTAQRFLDQQINEYVIRLSQAEKRLKEFKLVNSGRMPSEGLTYNIRLQQAATDLSGSRLELAEAENRHNVLQQHISEALQQQRKSDSLVAVLPIDQRIQNLEKNLDELLIRFTENHPDVIFLIQAIADFKMQREQEILRYATALPDSGNVEGQLVNTVYQQLKVRLAEEEASIASLRTRVDEYLKRYNELKDQISLLPQIEADLAALNRDYEINRQKHDELVASRELARISQQADRSGQENRFQVIDPPWVPQNPIGPNRFLLMSMVLVAGLGGGVGLAFLIVQLWPTFDNRVSLMRISDIPVFGSVTMVMSPETLRRERRFIAVYIFLGGMLLLIYAGLFIMEVVRVPSVNKEVASISVIMDSKSHFWAVAGSDPGGDNPWLFYDRRPVQL